MKYFCSVLFLFFSIFSSMQAQDLPYFQIPEYPESYTAGSVSARMVDGLGFRYYWATEGLRPEDLNYKPSEKGRTSDETIAHIYGLSKVVVNATLKQTNDRPETLQILTFEEKRKKTLENFKTAADILRKADVKEMEEFIIIFGSGDKETKYPFWNNINGPIADAIWHAGQVVLLRRASGNPFNAKVSVFTGRLRD